MASLRGFLHRHREILSYLFWGAFTTLVSWGGYSVFVLSLRPLLPERLGTLSPTVLLANALSWVLAVAFAFVTNKLWVFESRSWRQDVFLPELAKFVSARFATGILEIAGVPLLVSLGLSAAVWGIDGFAAKILVTVFVVLLNYVFSKLLIFRDGQCEH